jgi:ribonuclease HI
MSDDPHALKLYIDGNCYKNPGGAGAIACVAHFPEDWNRPDEIVFDEGFHETTNNRMELCACIRALEYVADKGRDLGVVRVLIVTDSKYVYDNHKRPVTWRSNKWMNPAGVPIENPDLWKRFLTAIKNVKIRTEIIWKKGKKSPTLKMVDRAAKDAGKAPRKFDRGFRLGKVAMSKVKGGSASMYAAKGVTETIRIYRSGIIGKKSHKITFDLYDKSSERYTEKCYAYAEIDIVAQLRRQHCYRMRFNSDPKHPVIEEVIEEIACASIEAAVPVNVSSPPESESPESQPA